MRLLAVDDDEGILALMTASLSTAGFDDVETANGAAEAIEILQAGGPRFHCILLDIQMPGLDGIELCQWLRRQEAYRATPILMVTAKSDNRHVDRAFAAGASGYLAKPFEVHQLCARVLAAVSAQRAEPPRGVRPLARPAPNARPENARFADPVHLTGTPGAVSYTELVAHVMRIGTIDLLATRIFAFKLSDAGKIYAGSTADEFLSLLNVVGWAVASSLADTEFRLAYAGEGVFACVAHARGSHTRGSLESVEATANLLLREHKAADRLGHPLDLRLHCGSQLRAGAFRTGNSLIEILPLAIQSAVNGAHAVQAAAEVERLPFGRIAS